MKTYKIEFSVNADLEEKTEINGLSKTHALLLFFGRHEYSVIDRKPGCRFSFTIEEAE